jgi:prevent-host-death family protein
MKTESLREVKNNLSSVIEQLPQSGPVLITKSGKARAMLIPVSDNTDLESLLLSNNPKFWRLFDRAARSKKWTALEDLPE